MPSASSSRHILVTGATGYIGGRLFPILNAAGYRVRCMAREPSHVRCDHAAIDVVRGDVLDRASLDRALNDIDTAFYLVHSMGSTGSFEEEDARAATQFGEAARAAGVRHIIYLGGLADPSHELSAHLRSRLEVGALLRAAGVPVTEFQASIIIGSGSLSFEMIRALVERLPFMITPRWVATLAQPIAIRDVLDYLVKAVDQPPPRSVVYQIGGADQVSYRDLMIAYAEARGLRRHLVAVPVLSPRLSSLWLGLVTPLYARVGRKLVDSLRHPTICRDQSAVAAFDVRPLGYRAAIQEALRNEDRAFAETRWSDALSSSGAVKTPAGLRYGNRLIDRRQCMVPCPPDQAFRPIRRIGGERGWYYANALWTIRGGLDRLVGGPGMRRGRRDPEHLHDGDIVDCWRVETIEEPHRLRLRAEMKLPGRAWLEFTVTPAPQGSTITQTAMFDPVGLPGILYWYSIYPLHEVIFAGMLRAIARRAMEDHAPDARG